MSQAIDHLGVETEATPLYDQWEAVYEEFGNGNCGSLGSVVNFCIETLSFYLFNSLPLQFSVTFENQSRLHGTKFVQ
jgi:hypothetical protein